jgi:hypothetical protein
MNLLKNKKQSISIGVYKKSSVLLDNLNLKEQENFKKEKKKKRKKKKNNGCCLYFAIAMIQSMPNSSWLDNGFKMLVLSTPWISLIHVSLFWIRIQIKNTFPQIKIRAQCLR